MNNKQRLLAGALLLGGGVVLGALAINVAENSTSSAHQKQMSPAVQGKVLQPSEPIAIPDKEDDLAPVEIKELPHGGTPSVVNTAAEQIAKKAEVDRLSRHYQEAEEKAQEAQRSAQQLQLQQALSGQNKSLLTPAQQADAEKLRQAESQAKADAEKKRLAEEAEVKRKAELAQAEAEKKRQAELNMTDAEKKRLAEQTEAKRKAELASTEAEKKRQAELQAKSEAEKKRLAEQAEAKRKAEAEKKRQEQLKADADKKRQAEAEKKRLAEQAEAKRKAEVEKKRLAEQAEAKRKAEIEKKRQEQLKAEAEKKRLAEQAEAKRKTETEKKAELEKKRKAEQAKKDAKSPQDHAQWMVQIALADKANANAMAGKLRSKGYRVTLSPTSKGVRVLVGPHKDRAAADSVRQRIARDGSLNMRSAWVHSWVPLEYRK